MGAVGQVTAAHTMADLDIAHVAAHGRRSAVSEGNLVGCMRSVGGVCLEILLAVLTTDALPEFCLSLPEFCALVPSLH